MTTLTDVDHLVALGSLPFMTAERLHRLLAGRSPDEAWQFVRRGGSGDGMPSEQARVAWQHRAASIDPSDAGAACRRLGIDVVVGTDPRFPFALRGWPDAPPVLYVRGNLDVLDGPCAGVVGTRRCTSGGRETARRWGRELADAGVRVVSGLALGIDGAAHAGALAAHAAPPVGVVGSGLDVVYPRRHAQLWHDVATAGVLLSEAPPGAPPERWRFPARNRILAALSPVLVVVESHARGGSLLTGALALERGQTVMAVPGSVRSPAAVGTNALIADGAAVAVDSADVLLALGLEPRPSRQSTADRRPRPSGAAASVLAAVRWEPTPVEEIVAIAGRPLLDVLAHLARLEVDGWVRNHSGWWERAAAPSR